MHQKSSSCKWAALVGMCLLGAVVLQLLVVLIGIAFAAAVGTEYHMLETASRLLCWPVFFLSLLTALIMTIKQALKCCFMMSKQGCHSEQASDCCKKDATCVETKD
jgi:type VI protein secretion system component VasK